VWKLALAVSLTVSLVALGMANAHQTQLNYFVGEPVTIRVAVLVGICYLAGALSVLIGQLASDAKQRLRDRSRSRRRKRRHLPVIEEEL